MPTTVSDPCQSEDVSFMRLRTSIVLAALAVTLVLPGAVGARNGDAAAASAKAEHDRIVAYWTPARIAAAKAKDFRVDPKSGKITPFARPGGSGGTGASWTGNGAVEERIGRILFSSGGSDWICSGSVVNDTASTVSVVLTAGHCVYDGTDGWSYNFMFMPDFDDDPNYTCAQRVLGCWTATRLAANSDFVPSGFGPNAALRVDYGFALVGAGSKGGQLDATVGGYNLKTSGVTTNDTQWAFGYPAEGRYKGRDLIYCTGKTIDDPNGVGTWGMACNMNGGSSGGGWLWGTTNPADGSGSLSSVNSYGYSGLTYMFGPRFNAETTTVMGDVLDGSQTAGASRVCNTGATKPNC
jgi:V8-like Glu-specific endopeptidase